MEFTFYIAGLLAILATLKVITNTNPVHTLLYFIISLLALSMVFFSLGAYFAGSLEIIVYAGAIMVLFVFIVMILNLGEPIQKKEKWLKLKNWIGPVILSAVLLALFVYGITTLSYQNCISDIVIHSKNVAITLFSLYIFAVELTSLLLLAGLVVAFHIGRDRQQTYTNIVSNMKTEKE
ncbi:NADH-quinone oxidoreductase subunit J [Candidatus Hartigia pinicola]|nr:NADH-quinone oxidoreductase subunit J [Candidatus Hartigia pinicola]